MRRLGGCDYLVEVEYKRRKIYSRLAIGRDDLYNMVVLWWLDHAVLYGPALSNPDS